MEQYFRDGKFQYYDYAEATGWGGFPRIRAAFKELRNNGYFSRMNFWCCQSCGWAAVPKGKGEKVVFFHSQDAHTLERDGDCYLAWAGDGEFIVETLKKYGLEPEWNGDRHTRIKIHSRIRDYWDF